MAGFRIRRKLPLLLGCLLVIFLFVKKGKQLQEYELFIPGEDPRGVWEVVADFSNMPHLNTRIERWELLEEGGNYDRWHYGVITYESMVGGWLLGLNENHGQVMVEPLAPPNHYYHQEVYTTHSLHGLLIDEPLCGGHCVGGCAKTVLWTHLIVVARVETQLMAPDSGLQLAIVEDSGLQHASVEDSGLQHASVEDSGLQHAIVEDSGLQHAIVEDSGLQHAIVEDSFVNRHYFCTLTVED
ncbi:uncharacterized protein [Cherax quadricarinatus]|uniref:uncharacterized protein isoform X3 n=1 Tax=Cherax quadricarinatus TaxID=27406 RepID=UPI00387EC115